MYCLQLVFHLSSSNFLLELNNAINNTTSPQTENSEHSHSLLSLLYTIDMCAPMYIIWHLIYSINPSSVMWLISIFSYSVDCTFFLLKGFLRNKSFSFSCSIIYFLSYCLWFWCYLKESAKINCMKIFLVLTWVLYSFIFISLACFYFVYVLKYIFFVPQSVVFWKLVSKHCNVRLVEALKICPKEIWWDVIYYVSQNACLKSNWYNSPGILENTHETLATLLFPGLSVSQCEPTLSNYSCHHSKCC